MHTSFSLAEKGKRQMSRGLSSWWLCKSGQRQTRQYMTCGRPLRCETCSRPSKDLGIVTHSLGSPGLLKAFSSDSRAPFFFFSFFTRESTAFSAHFSSSSPCFQPSNLLTAGEVKEKRLFRLDIEVDILRPRAIAPAAENIRKREWVHVNINKRVLQATFLW